MELNERILHYLDKQDKVDTLKLASEFNEDHQKIVGAVKSLEALEMVVSDTVKNTKWELTEEGQLVAEKGSHEAVLYHSVPDGGIAQAEIMKTVPNAKVGFSKAMSAGWILIDKSGGAPLVKKKVETITDTVQDYLNEIKKGIDNLPDNVRNDYKKRKLLQEVTLKSFLLSKGPQFATSIKKLETDLTAEMLQSGSWKTLEFKPYNFDALGQPPESGHLHPLLKVRSEFREIFLEMGFTEMPTNNYVESSFWNFDALFQPQQHPARDAHDTFFVSNPAVTTKFPMDYLERVKKVHSEGGYGSQGYRYSWKIEEAQKNLLRTHTTAVSARMLYKVAQEGFRPQKYFSIDKVFRNETLDATHLAEFHQVEGVVADRGLGLADLIGVLDTFFKRLGFDKLQFKPAYNPYTEPSMEIFAFHNVDYYYLRERRMADLIGVLDTFFKRLGFDKLQFKPAYNPYTEPSMEIFAFHNVDYYYLRERRMADLIGVLDTFFKRLGFDKLQFKPAYNPYTEPSMEIFAFHNGLNKWIEIGNSGVFRPEMLLPMGLPEDVNVIAWGLSLERPTMIKYGLNNIRDLVGPKVDLQMVQSNPICRLDK
ncbi:hypothetical protein JYU34_004009 [Plutella xylostella]|uniref:phenylalanine--tRNA ligase n=1 Tax=Plutella xylostella TaxID=51655 RepID=A0ABQ7QWY1_PLUXY|nr:hypothetical protein JYU34_004009 [Plutella xylostella]